MNKSDPYIYDLEISDLIRLCYIYILERDIIARAHYNCFGCEQEAPGQRDHMQSGCLSEWEDLVHQNYPEAVMAQDLYLPRSAGKLSISLVVY